MKRVWIRKIFAATLLAAGCWSLYEFNPGALPLRQAKTEISQLASCNVEVKVVDPDNILTGFGQPSERKSDSSITITVESRRIVYSIPAELTAFPAPQGAEWLSAFVDPELRENHPERALLNAVRWLTLRARQSSAKCRFPIVPLKPPVPDPPPAHMIDSVKWGAPIMVFASIAMLALTRQRKAQRSSS